jgi:hypothetical protein
VRLENNNQHNRRETRRGQYSHSLSRRTSSLRHLYPSVRPSYRRTSLTGQFFSISVLFVEFASFNRFKLFFCLNQETKMKIVSFAIRSLKRNSSHNTDFLRNLSTWPFPGSYSIPPFFISSLLTNVLCLGR